MLPEREGKKMNGFEMSVLAWNQVDDDDDVFWSVWVKLIKNECEPAANRPKTRLTIINYLLLFDFYSVSSLISPIYLALLENCSGRQNFVVLNHLIRISIAVLFHSIKTEKSRIFSDHFPLFRREIEREVHAGILSVSHR